MENMVDVRVIESKSLVKTISVIRKYSSESMAEIKRRIEAHEPVFERESDEVSNIKAVLRVYNTLTKQGDICELYEDGEKTTVELMKNSANMIRVIDNYIYNHPE